jgi:hypothetical protein
MRIKVIEECRGYFHNLARMTMIMIMEVRVVIKKVLQKDEVVEIVARLSSI